MTGVTSTVQFAVAMGCLGIIVLVAVLAVAFCIWCNARKDNGQDEESQTESNQSSLVVLSPRPVSESAESDSAWSTEQVGQPTGPERIQVSDVGGKQRLSTIPESVSEVQGLRSAGEDQPEAVVAEIHEEPRLSQDFTGVGFVINLRGGHMLAE
jgi:hypothetical protein